MPTKIESLDAAKDALQGDPVETDVRAQVEALRFLRRSPELTPQLLPEVLQRVSDFRGLLRSEATRTLHELAPEHAGDVVAHCVPLLRGEEQQDTTVTALEVLATIDPALLTPHIDAIVALRGTNARMNTAVLAILKQQPEPVRREHRETLVRWLEDSHMQNKTFKALKELPIGEVGPLDECTDELRNIAETTRLGPQVLSLLSCNERILHAPWLRTIILNPKSPSGVASSAVKVLETLPPEALATVLDLDLVRIVTDSAYHPGVCAQVASLIGRLPEPILKQYAELLAAAVHASNSRVAAMAMKALSGLRKDDIDAYIPALLPKLAGRHIDVTLSVLELLACLDAHHIAKYAREVCDCALRLSANPRFRPFRVIATALAVLAQLGTHATLSLYLGELVDFVEDAQAAIRAGGVKLFMMADWRAVCNHIPTLLHILAHPEAHVREGAVQILSRCMPPALDGHLDAIVPVLRHESHGVVESALEVARRLEPITRCKLAPRVAAAGPNDAVDASLVNVLQAPSLFPLLSTLAADGDVLATAAYHYGAVQALRAATMDDSDLFFSPSAEFLAQHAQQVLDSYSTTNAPDELSPGEQVLIDCSDAGEWLRPATAPPAKPMASLFHGMWTAAATLPDGVSAELCRSALKTDWEAFAPVAQKVLLTIVDQAKRSERYRGILRQVYYRERDWSVRKYRAQLDRVLTDTNCEEYLQISQRLREDLAPRVASCVQRHRDFITLLVHAAERRPRFNAFLELVATKTGSIAVPGPIKGPWRALEKVVLRPGSTQADSALDASHLCDCLRGSLICKDFTVISSVLEWLTSLDQDIGPKEQVEHVDSGFAIRLLRAKCRFTTPTSGGWADLLLNFVFVDDEEAHVVELQVQHETLLRVRKEGNAHEKYNSFRAAFEILETAGHAPVDSISESYVRPVTLQKRVEQLETDNTRLRAEVDTMQSTLEAVLSRLASLESSGPAAGEDTATN